MIARVLLPSMLFLLAAVGGCQGARRPIFPELQPPVVWPQHPDQPRIRYIGELTGEASLRVQPSGWEALRAVFVGAKPKMRFSTPIAVACDGDRLYVADGQLAAIHKLDLDARTYAMITRAADAPLEGPSDVVLLDNRRFAVADSRRKSVFVFDEDGSYTHSIGADVLERPSNLAWNEATKELWVLDAAAHACFVFDASGKLLRRVGERGQQPLQFNYPAGLGYRQPFGLVVADSMNFRVQQIDRDGAALGLFGRKGDAAGDFSLPRDAAMDSEGHIYVLDSQFENIQLFDRDGRFLMAFGREGHGPGEFYLPSGITIDKNDRIWVADTYNRRVQVFQYLREDQTWNE